MKQLKFLFTGLFLIVFSAVSAQGTTVTLPDWGVAGSDNARYYYIPDIETYYDVRTRDFVYMNDGKWVRNVELPAQYRDYDLYDGYKVVLTDDAEPFADFDNMKIKYAKGYKGDPQKTVKIKKNKVKIKEK